MSKFEKPTPKKVKRVVYLYREYTDGVRRQDGSMSHGIKRKRHQLH